MSKKMKSIMVVSLILAVAASVVYAAPVLAYMNGTADQIRDRDQDRLRDQTCDFDCDGLQTHPGPRSHSATSTGSCPEPDL